MKKPYETHEILYQRMKTEGIRSWEECNAQNEHHKGVEAHMERFMVDTLCQSWAPCKGKAIELGCGTGPIVRWLANRGFKSVGVEISKTAIAMAKEQSKGIGVRFTQADVCNMELSKLGRFDLVVDGHCLHCITQPEDRKAFLSNVYKLLKPGGVFLIASMCSPIDRGGFYKNQHGKLIGSTVYIPWERPEKFKHIRSIRGKSYLPTRYIGHWKSILAEVRAAGFRQQLVRLNLHRPEHPVSSICVAALIEE